MAIQQPLAAQSPALGLFPAFCFDTEQKLIFGKDNTIHHAASIDVVLQYHTTSHFLSDDTREFMDAKGKVLFGLARVRTTGDTKLTISNKPVSDWDSSVLFSTIVKTATGTREQHVTFHNAADQKPITLIATTSVTGKENHKTVFNGNAVIAKVEWETPPPSPWGKPPLIPTTTMSVAPHVDVAIVAAIFGPAFLSFEIVGALDMATRARNSAAIKDDLEDKMYDLAKEMRTKRV